MPFEKHITLLYSRLLRCDGGFLTVTVPVDIIAADTWVKGSTAANGILTEIQNTRSAVVGAL